MSDRDKPFTVAELIEELMKHDPNAIVELCNAGEAIMGSELTGCMGYNDEDCYSVRKTEKGVMLAAY